MADSPLDDVWARYAVEGSLPWTAGEYSGRLTRVVVEQTTSGDSLSALQFELTPGVPHEQASAVYRSVDVSLSDDVHTTYQSVGGGLDPLPGRCVIDRLFVPRIPAAAKRIDVVVSTADGSFPIAVVRD